MLPNSIAGIRMSFIWWVRTRRLLIRCVGIPGLVVTATLMGLAFASPTPMPYDCPKILMFDGLEINTQNNNSMAKYWGQKIGVDGFFVNNVMSSWDDSVGDDENSPLYQRVKRFQELYSKYGVTDNFIKVALYTKHDWRTSGNQTRVISNFRHAAHLARYAGLEGMALDLEAYVNGYWNEDPAIPDKGERVFALGQAIGRAMISEFPDATIIVFPEVLTYASPPYGSGVHQAYALSSRFWDGLIQAHFKQLVIATESSYDSGRPDLIAYEIQHTYQSSLRHNGVDPKNASIAVGIWPLANSITDKSARSSPAQFEERLTLALIKPSPYVWIYGFGSGWQKGGPYGNGGDVDPHFEEFVKVIHRVKKSCSVGGGAFQH